MWENFLNFSFRLVLWLTLLKLRKNSFFFFLYEQDDLPPGQKYLYGYTGIWYDELEKSFMMASSTLYAEA